jgi:hypothetical protein
MSRSPLRAVLFLSLLTGGCANLDWPYLSNPDSLTAERRELERQRARAHRWDPFPDSEAGPAMPETRPRDFQDAPPEPSRARWVRPSSTAVQF